MDFSASFASVPAARSASIRLPENAKMAYTSCSCCPCGSWNPSQEAFWCSQFHSHYDAYDGCSKGPCG